MDARSYNAQFLDALSMRLRSMEKTIQQSFRDLDQTQLNWKPNPQAWSIGQILDHLITTNELYFGKLEGVMADGPPPNKPFKPGWLGGWFADKMGPEQRKVNVPKIFRPSESAISTEILVEFGANTRKFESYLQQARNHDLNRYLSSPVTALIRLKTGDAFQVMVNHIDRHRHQAFGVMELAAFPS